MTWLNPPAFVGLLALAVPILVHLFGRRIAKRQRFPTLRLLLATRATPATRSRPSDLLLLILRCAVVVAAVLALAQPRWLATSRQREAAVPVRLILVDTSASMKRLTSDGGTAVDRARMLARALLDSSREGMVVESDHPRANIAGAASWLSGRSGLRELVIVSDFQVGTFSDGHLASLPDGIGLSLRRIGGAPGVGVAVADSGSIVVEPHGGMNKASWRNVGIDAVVPFTLLTAPSDSAAARSMLDALRATVPGISRPSRGVTVEFPGSAPTTSAASTFSSAWQGDLLLSLRTARLLHAAGRSATVSSTCVAPGAVLARNRSGQVVASMTAVDSGVVLHSCADAGSVAATALLAATAIAVTPMPTFDEREPDVLPDDRLRTWERPPTVFAPRGDDETSPDGRWFWLAAIALLVLEQVVRRGKATRSTYDAGGDKHERAA